MEEIVANKQINWLLGQRSKHTFRQVREKMSQSSHIKRIWCLHDFIHTKSPNFLERSTISHQIEDINDSLMRHTLATGHHIQPESDGLGHEVVHLGILVCYESSSTTIIPTCSGLLPSTKNFDILEQKNSLSMNVRKGRIWHVWRQRIWGWI